MSLYHRIRDILKRNFISGALVVAPLILTFILLKFLFETIDGVLAPFVEHFFGYSIPGLGLITTILLILLIGFFTCNLVGANFLRRGEKLLNRFPGVRTIYSAAKQLVEGVTLPNKHAFKQVVLVEYPRHGAYALAFLVKRPNLDIDDNGTPTPLACLFVPSTPTPVSGMVILVPPEDVVLLDMTIEEGFKFLVSGGIASPQRFSGRRLAVKVPDDVSNTALNIRAETSTDSQVATSTSESKTDKADNSGQITS